MLCQALIFDLDGTLLDTLDDIAQAMNTALIALGARPHPVENYRNLVGRGLEILAYKVLPKDRRDPATVAECVQLMRIEYAKIWALSTKPYPGINELLALLADRKIKTAVLSNKADDFAKITVAHFFPAHHFELVQGSCAAFPNKPDAAGALHIAKTIGVAPGDCVFIGDSDIDMQTGRNAGMFTIGVLWGFRTAQELLANGAKRLVSKPGEILEQLSEK